MFTKISLKYLGFFMFIVTLLGIFTLGSSSNVLAKTPDVYVSVYPIYDLTSKIAGDRANVNLIVPNGTELHGYEPSPRQIAALERADIFFYIGLGLESWVEKAVENLEREKIETVQLSKTLKLLKYDEEHSHEHEEIDHHHDHEDIDHHHDHEHEETDCHHEKKHEDTDCHHEKEHEDTDCHHEHEDIDHHCHGHGEYDSHVWLDPINMKEMARIIKENLALIDSSNKEYYQDNYNQFLEQINELDKEYKEVLANMHSEYIMVSHAAFGYLGARYGFKQLAVTGIFPHAEPSPGNMANLIKAAKEHNIKYIFMETLASPRTVNVLAEEADLEILSLNPVAGLTEKEQAQEEDYFTIMRKNLRMLERALVD